ncbi:putative UMP-CMP kinase 2 [Arabidopsis thaliana]
MWRRVALLSPMISSSSRSLKLSQAASGLKVGESFATDIINQDERVSPPKEKAPFITFVLGGPGSGKGTQCEKIVETFGLQHLSAGDLLRREIAMHTENGAMILNLIKDGKIVPSEVTVKLIQKELESSDNRKFLIDGFPRTEENRVAFERIIRADPDVVLFFDCPEEEMVKRVLNRNQGRIDDNITTMKKRLKIFNALNRPINAVGTVDDIFQHVLPIFNSFEQLKESSHVNPQSHLGSSLVENSS